MQESGNTAGQHSYDTGEITGRHIFALALAASLALHLFWLSSVRISVSAPAPMNRPGSAVSFIGSILEEGPVFPAPGQARDAADTGIVRLRDLAVSPLMARDSAIPGGSGRLKSVSDLDVLKEMEEKSPAGAALYAKQVPEKPFDEIKVAYKTYPSEIEGPARFREVIYKPELPTNLRWDESLGVDLDRLGNKFSVKLKFLVSPEGRVGAVERLSSSGHPTVDIIAMRYLKEWQFAPLKAAGPKEEQWGTVRLNFSLNKAETR
ncbi:MAG: energy transducer TonB [Candidatus Omnitrophica bacterium]|nr:energy transducer TonB [Candidatus Omnitrophota bacterium]